MKIFFKCILMFFVFSLLNKIDVHLAKNRALFIANEISLFEKNGGEISYDLTLVSDLFKSSQSNPESYCEFFNSKIDGVGFCFYTYNGDGRYYLLIYSFFNSLLYSSESHEFTIGDGLN